ncbi:MAG: hypothetical protein ABI904_02005 [Chloroflexota bacterium]
MNQKKIMLASLLSLIAILFTVQIAFAHETVSAGNYEIEYGWINEPPIVGQRNAFVVNISDSTAPDAEIDVSNLMVMVSYGGQSKNLELQPLGEDTPGQFIAPILPTVAGIYTLELTGKLGDADVNISVQPEEVQGADTLEFPKTVAPKSSGFGMTDWLSVIALVISLVGAGLGFAAFRKSR